SRSCTAAAGSASTRTARAGGAPGEKPSQSFGVPPRHHRLPHHRHRPGRFEQRMPGCRLCGDGHVEAAAGLDGYEEGLLPVLEMPGQGAISEPGPIRLIDDTDDDARPDRHGQIAAVQPPRRGRPERIESKVDDLSMTDVAGWSHAHSRALLQRPGESCLPCEWEQVRGAEVEVVLKPVHGPHSLLVFPSGRAYDGSGVLNERSVHA